MDGYYINLKHRKDRENHIKDLKQKYPFFENIKRMEAVYNKRGDIGCSLSHIKCLNEILKKNDQHYLIMEDDFFIFNPPYFEDFLKEFEKIKHNKNWDILVLTPLGNIVKKYYISGFNKINNNQTATCYILKNHMIKTLLKCYQNSLLHLMNNEDPNLWALDRGWKPLQLQYNFIYYDKIFGGQLPSYSDIEKKNVDYNKYFMKQKKSRKNIYFFLIFFILFSFKIKY